MDGGTPAGAPRETAELPLHDYDWVTVWIDSPLPHAAKAALDGGTESTRDGVPVRWQGQASPDVRVHYYPQRELVRVSGSSHKHALGESVGRHGPAEVLEFVSEMADRLHLPLEAVVGGRVSRFDLAVNVRVEADVAEYVRIMGPPSKMSEVGSGPRSVAFKNSVAEVVVYDKVRKLADRKRGHLVPDAWAGGNWLRVEVRFKGPRHEFGRAVTVSDLGDPAFYARAVGRWLGRVESIALQDGAWPVPFAARPREMVERLAVIGLHASGGPGAMAERIDRGQELGLIDRTNAGRERQWVRRVLGGGDPTAGAALRDEFWSKTRAAARRSREAALTPAAESAPVAPPDEPGSRGLGGAVSRETGAGAGP